MFRLVRCPKCGHGIAGENDVANRILDMIHDITRDKNYNHSPGLIQETAALRSYLKQVLHWQFEYKRYHDEAIIKARVLVKYLLDNDLISKDQLTKIDNEARAQVKKNDDLASKNLERIYGEIDNICVNTSVADPTFRKAAQELKKKK